MTRFDRAQAVAHACRTIALRLGFTVLGLGALAHGASAQEAQIRKALTERLPPSATVDEVLPSPIPGLYEVRSGVDIFYADRNGDYVIRGELLDTRRRVNLTEERIAALSAIDFSKLPLQDAIVAKRGKGSRKLAVFADPDCPYCKQLEAVIEGRDDVVVYTFLMPILGPGALQRAKSIWCSSDRAAAWHSWMREGKAPTAQVDCDTSSLERNAAFGTQHGIRSTPTLIFLDGARTSSAVGALELERLFAQHQPAQRK